MGFDFKFFGNMFLIVLGKLPVTLFVAITSMLIALVIGYAVDTCRRLQIPVLKQLAELYVYLVRSFPVIVIIYMIYYGTPVFFATLNDAFGLTLPESRTLINPYIFGVAALSLNSGAFLAEVIRSAMRSVGKGQTEAALSIGMTDGQVMRRIIIPQALAAAIPNLGNSFLNLIKATSLVYRVTIIDMMAVATIAAALDFRYLESYTVVAIVYWLLCVVFEKLFVVLEKSASKYKKPV